MANATALDAIRAVVFDVGETLVDESRMWSEAALSAGITPFALMGVIGAMIERGTHHDAAWELLGLPVPVPRPALRNDDIYCDAMECLTMVREVGLRVGIAGNQPEGVVDQLNSMGFAADFVGSSSGWQVSKPSPEFFDHVVAAARCKPREILYVGDRLDNDVLPAHAAGLLTAFLRRGPWGYLHSQRIEVESADLQLDSLAELTSLLSSRI